MLDGHSQQLRVDCCMRKVEAVLRDGIERDIHDCGVGRASILSQYDASHERPAYPRVQPPRKPMTCWIGRERVKPALAAAENIEPHLIDILRTASPLGSDFLIIRAP
jgi:hypothetical protein